MDKPLLKIGNNITVTVDPFLDDYVAIPSSLERKHVAISPNTFNDLQKAHKQGQIQVNEVLAKIKVIDE